MQKRFIRNALFFIVLIVLMFFFLFKGQNIEEIWNVVSGVDLRFIFLGILSMSFYMMGDAINSKQLLKKFGYDRSLLETLKYAYIGFFYSAITPSSSGGQPMQLYHMNKDGIDISHGTMVLLLEAISYHSIALLYMVIGSILNGKYLVNNLSYFTIPFFVGITGTACILTVLLGLVFSKKASKFFSKIAIWFIKLLKLKNEESIIENLSLEIRKFRDSSEYLKKNKMMFLRVLGVTFMQMTAFYSVTYVTSVALGIHAPYIKILTLQAVLFSSVTSIPLPGSIGVSELGFGVLFLPIFHEKLIYSAVAINRFMNFYFYVLVSFVISLIAYFKIGSKHNA